MLKKHRFFLTPALSAVTACRPPLPGIDGLVVELNSSGQFGDFVKSVRQLFRQTV